MSAAPTWHSKFLNLMAIAANPYEAQDCRPAEGQTQAQAFMRALAKPAGVTAVTLRYGYIVHQDGTRSLFAPATISDERTNDRGRCTNITAKWKDGSGVRYRWSEDKGARYDYLK